MPLTYSPCWKPRLEQRAVKRRRNVEPFHLFRDLDEQVFRYDNRELANDGERFLKAMRHIAGSCITYQELTGKGTDTVHHEEAETRA